MRLSNALSQPLRRSQTRSFAVLDSMGDTINLAKGHPNPTNCVPYEALKKAMEASTKRLGDSMAGHGESGFPLNYGSGKGNSRILSTLADYMTNNGDGRECAASEDCLFITNGVSHGLDLVVQSYCREGDVVLVEVNFHRYISLTSRAPLNQTCSPPPY